MTVASNVGFGLRLQRRARAEIEHRVHELLEGLGLADFAERFPKDLSGGMRQRVAIARALAIDSPILLMDEPFGALDALTRRSLQDQLLEIWAKLKKTVVFVTHSIEESIYLSDRVVVMTFRPGTVKRELAVDLPRPRDPRAPAFNELARELSSLVMAEQERREAAERGGRGI
jgi:NitT/TauT family transport system ATP-binding protein